MRYAFLAQTGPNPYLFFLTYVVGFWIRVAIVVVTDPGIVILRGSSVWRSTIPKSVSPVYRAKRVWVLSLGFGAGWRSGASVTGCTSGFTRTLRRRTPSLTVELRPDALLSGPSYSMHLR